MSLTRFELPSLKDKLEVTAVKKSPKPKKLGKAPETGKKGRKK
jgi:hypothetical protein